MNRFITLKEAYKFDYPEEDETIWNYVNDYEFNNTKFCIVEINPVEWYNNAKAAQSEGEESIKEVFKFYALSDSIKAVEYYRTISQKLRRETYLIISSEENRLIDGHHRLVAYALENIETALAVNLSCEE